MRSSMPDQIQIIQKKCSSGESRVLPGLGIDSNLHTPLSKESVGDGTAWNGSDQHFPT